MTLSEGPLRVSVYFLLFLSVCSGALDEKKEAIFKCVMASVFDPWETHVNKDKWNLRPTSRLQQARHSRPRLISTFLIFVATIW